MAAALAVTACQSHHSVVGPLLADVRVSGGRLEVTECELAYERTELTAAGVVVIVLVLIPLVMLGGRGGSGGGGGGGDSDRLSQRGCVSRPIALRAGPRPAELAAGSRVTSAGPYESENVAEPRYAPAECTAPLAKWHKQRARWMAAVKRAEVKDWRRACLDRRSALMRRAQATANLNARTRLLTRLPECANRPAKEPTLPPPGWLQRQHRKVPAQCRAFATLEEASE